mgnify:CR=1 FL=1
MEGAPDRRIAARDTRHQKRRPKMKERCCISEHVVYHVGYRSRGWTPRVLAAAVRDRGLFLIDVRFSPGKPRALWSRERLSGLLGDAGYLWMGHLLGNRNYRGGPVELVDERKGLDLLVGFVLAGPVALMCACDDYAGCHRRIIIDALAGVMPDRAKIRAEELRPPELSGDSLFAGRG